MLLTELDDDVLIYILSYLTPSDILLTRKICKRLHMLSHLRIVWTNTCVNYVIQRGIPFPNIPLETLTLEKLEAYTIHSTRLGTKWLSHDYTPLRKWFIDATMNTSVTDVRLLPGSEGTLLCTLSKSVWSAITIWELDSVTARKGDPGFRKCCQWSPRGAIVTKFALNSCSISEATLAVSLLNNGNQTVELLSLKRSPESEYLQPMTSMPSTFKPITLDGDFLALSDDVNETIILNWRTGAYATLKSSEEEGNSIWQHDNCIQVVFAYQSIMVVRARSIHLFPFPVLRDEVEGILAYSAIARHSFGWIDGVSVKMRTQHPNLSSSSSSSSSKSENRVPLSLLIRAETDNPWSSDILSLQLYTLPPNPNYMPSEPSEPTDKPMPMDKITIPYIFPPILISNVESQRGAIRCTDIILGQLGTAMWIQPRDRSVIGLYWSTVSDDAPPGFILQENMNESLIAVAFSSLGDAENCVGIGNSQSSNDEMEVKKMKGSRVIWNDRNNWTSIDYDEEVGRVVLGSSFGQIVVVDL